MKSVLLFVILLGFTFASSDPLVIEIQLYVDVACNMLNQTQEVPVGVCMSIPALDSKNLHDLKLIVNYRRFFQMDCSIRHCYFK